MPHRIRPSRPARRLGPAVLLIVLLASGVVACSDGAKEPEAAPSLSPLVQIKDATFAEGSAAYAGETRFADGTSGPIEGMSQADPAAGEVTYPIGTPSGLQDLTVRWVENNVYIERALTSESSAISTTLRLASDPPWIRVPSQPLIKVVYDIYDPFGLLERLSELKVDVQRDGSESVDGTELQRYVGDLGDLSVKPAGAHTVELLTDSSERLQVVRLIGDATIEYELSDFGVAVSPTPPADDQIGSSQARPAIEPTGAFEAVATGSAPDAGSWSLLRAPGTDGGTCWRLDAATPVDPVAAQPGGITCISALDPTALPDDQVEVVVDAGSGASFDAVVAAVVPGATAARMQLADGTRVPLTVDPGGFVVYIGPKSPLGVVLEVTVPEATVVTCGPGSISELDDLNTISADEAARLDRAPWLCLAL